MPKVSMVELEENDNTTSEYAITLSLIEVPSTVAASTTNKGAYTISSNNLEDGEQFLIKFINGNTVLAPTITINSVACSIIGKSPCLPENIGANNIIEVIYIGNNQLIITKLIK